MKIRGYVRVSHREREKSGLSPRAQRRAISEYAARNYPGIPIEFYDDLSVSAFKIRLANRKGGGQLIKDTEKDDIVVMFSIDRGFRNILDFSATNQTIVGLGARLEFVNGGDFNRSAGSRLMANIIASVAEYSSAIKSERQREARAIIQIRQVESIYRPKKLAQVDSPYFAKDLDVHVPVASSDQSRVFGYIRCSHIDSLNSGLGLESQEMRVREYAKGVPGVFEGIVRDDAVSAFKVPFAERRAAGPMWRDLRRGDHVVVYRLDRAWRSLKDCVATIEEANERGVSFHIVDMGLDTSKEDSKLQLAVLALVSQMESEFTSRSTKAALHELARRGHLYGDVPFDAKIKKTKGTKQLVPDMEKIALMLWMQERKEKTGISCETLSDEMAIMQDEYSIPRRKRDKYYKNSLGIFWTPWRIEKSLARIDSVKAKFASFGMELPEPDPSWLSEEQVKIRRSRRSAACGSS